MSNQTSTVKCCNHEDWGLEFDPKEVLQVLLGVRAARRLLPGPVEANISHLVKIVGPYQVYAEEWKVTLSYAGEIFCVCTEDAEEPELAYTRLLSGDFHAPSVEQLKEHLDMLLTVFRGEVSEYLEQTGDTSETCQRQALHQAAYGLEKLINGITAEDLKQQ